jgi:hypothetical protein
MTNIDNMTEKQIESEIQELHKLSHSGKMTPAQARRLGLLRSAAFQIINVKKAAYWL